MKKKFTLLKFLAVLFQITEVFIGLGVVSTLVLFPYATRMVVQREGNLGIFVINGTPGFNYTHGSSGFSWSSMDDQSPGLYPELRPPLLPSASTLGRITFGRFRFRSDDGARQLNEAKNDGAVVTDALEGSFTFLGSTNASAILAPVKWPCICGILCTGVITIAILELLSRMFRKVEEGEIFTKRSIRHVQMIGLLFLASSLCKGAMAGWLKHAMGAVVLQHVATGTIYLDSSAKGDYSPGFVTGLVILALAEVFRQGLVLREENALTI